MVVHVFHFHNLRSTTDFKFSSERGKLSDLGQIRKNRPEGCSDLCCAACTDVDGYSVGLDESSMGGRGLTASQKLTYLASAVQLDYMFFEKDNSFCTYSEQAQQIHLTCCLWYCCGLMQPVYCCFPAAT